MMKTTALTLLAVICSANAFVGPSSFARHAVTGRSVSRSSASTSPLKMDLLDGMDDIEKSVVTPGGGFWFGANGFWGEEDYRGFVDSYKSQNLINGVYPIVERVRSKKLLTTTSEAGLLSALSDAGLTLSEIEKVLPALEESGILSFSAKNADVLINLFGFLAVEPAELALPAVVSVVRTLSSLGLLKLNDLGSAVSSPAPAPAPVAVKSAPVKVAKAPSVMVKAAKPAPKVVAAPKKVATKVVAAKKVAPKVVAAKKVAVKAAVKAAPKPAPKKAVAKKVVASAGSPRGNMANIPKAV